MNDVTKDLLEALKDCERVIDILWVSHHANRADAALEKARAAIARAEAALASPQPDTDGWIPWDGVVATHPVVFGDVEVRFRNGRLDCDKAYRFCWEHSGHDYDIIAYRLVESQP